MLAAAHVTPGLVRRLYEDFFAGTPGLHNEVMTEEQIADWRARFAKRFPAGLADRLVAWWRGVEKTGMTT